MEKQDKKEPILKNQLKKLRKTQIWTKILNRTRQTPKLLTEDEIEELKKVNPKKVGLRYLFFLIGTGLIITSILFFYYAVTVSWFIVR